MLCSEIHEPTDFVTNKEKLPEQRKESITVPVGNKGDTADVIIEAYNAKFHLTLKCNLSNSSNIILSRLKLYVEEIIGVYHC
jgi:hypothetical protein